MILKKKNRENLPINLFFTLIILLISVFIFYQIKTYFTVNDKLEEGLLKKSNDISTLIQITLQREIENKYNIEELFYNNIFMQFRNYKSEILPENYILLTSELKVSSGLLPFDINKNFHSLKEIFDKKIQLVEYINDGQNIYLSGNIKNGSLLIAKFPYPVDLINKISIEKVLDSITKSSKCKKIIIHNKNSIIYSSGSTTPIKNIKIISREVTIYDTLNDDILPIKIELYNDITFEAAEISKNFYNMIISILFSLIVIILMALYYFIQKKYHIGVAYIANKEKEILMGTMAAGVAHEIRNPLNSINYSVAFIKKLVQDNIRVEKYLNIISSEIDKINSTVEEFLSIRKEVSVSKEEFNFLHLIYEVIALFEAECVEKNIYVNLHNHIKNEIIIGDRSKLREVIVNMFKNSVESLSSQNINKSIEITLEHNHFIIKDTGCGIAHENLNNLFNFYFTTKENGNGIGLFRAKKILDAHNWKIEVNSKVNEGTTFKIFFHIN
jgi:signal transduction histidine kinase